MHRKFLLALIAMTLTVPSFAQEGEKKTKKAKAAEKQDGDSTKKAKQSKPQTEQQKKKAAERKKKAAERRKKAGQGRKRQQQSFVMNMLKAVELSEAQTPAVKKVAAAFDPKFAALRAKQNNILTDEQKKVLAEARAKAREARKAQGKKQASEKQAPAAEKKPTTEKKGRQKGQRRGGQMGPIELTKEQQKLRREITTQQRELRTQVVAKLKDVLTEDQQALLPGAGRTRKSPKKRKKSSGEAAKKKQKGSDKDKTDKK